MNWRLITDDNVSGSFGLAADDAIAQRVATGVSLPTLRLYTYHSHCALVGRFQNIENEIHLDYCRSHGIAVNRRPTGGGAIIMGENQLGVALMIPAGGEDTYGRARELMEKFSAGLVWALNQLGVEAQFRRKNDIEVNGRKIAGLGIYRAGNGGLLFHASLLVDLDVPLMLRVLNTPFEKISDKEIATVAGRTTTVRREMIHDIALNDVRQKVAEGYAATFKVELEAGEFTTDELQQITRLEREKYLSPAWIFQTTEVADTVGTAKMKTSGGLLEVKVALAGRLLKAVYLTGDFFVAENAVADLEASLRWHSSAPEAIAATLQSIYARRRDELSMIPSAALIETIQLAAQKALAAEAHEHASPYGCFVDPEAAYA
jgi:lipoate-protein ligase A